MVSKKHVKKIPVVGVRTARVICMIFPLTRIATNILKGVNIFRKGGRDEDYNLEGDCDFEIRIPEKGDTIFVINTITHS